MRVMDHPILCEAKLGRPMTLHVDGRPVTAYEGDTIAAALLASEIKVFRRTVIKGEPRGVFCAIGRCTDCVMTVDGKPNVRTCVTPAVEGMKIQTQMGLGSWEKDK